MRSAAAFSREVADDRWTSSPASCKKATVARETAEEAEQGVIHLLGRCCMAARKAPAGAVNFAPLAHYRRLRPTKRCRRAANRLLGVRDGVTLSRCGSSPAQTGAVLLRSSVCQRLPRLLHPGRPPIRASMPELRECRRQLPAYRVPTVGRTCQSRRESYRNRIPVQHRKRKDYSLLI